MKKCILVLCCLSLLQSCKKEAEVKPSQIQVFDLGLRPGFKPEIFKVWDNSMVMGFIEAGADSATVYRLVKISKTGVVEQNIFVRVSDLFQGYSNLFSNFKLSFENDRLFLSTQGIKPNKPEEPSADLRPYFLVTEFDKQMVTTTFAEKKVQIGNLNITGNEDFFFKMVGDELIFAANTMDAAGDKVVYVEKSDLYGNTKLYKKIPGVYWEKMVTNATNFFAYGYSNPATRQVFAYDPDGQPFWTHEMSYSASVPDILNRKINMTISTTQILIIPEFEKSTISPLITYSCGLNGVKLLETELTLDQYNHLNYLKIDNGVIYYTGKTCTGENKCRLFWAKTDSDFNVLFTKILPDEYSKNMQALFVLENETGYFVFGTKDDFSGNAPQCFFLNTDKEGEIL